MGLLKDIIKIMKVKKLIDQKHYTEAFNTINNIDNQKLKEKWIFQWQLTYEQFNEKLTNFEKKNDYENALKLLSTLFENSYSKKYINEYKENLYNTAINYYKQNDINSAKRIFESIVEYKNCLFFLEQCINEIDYQKAQSHIQKKEYIKAKKIFENINKYKDSNKLISICTLEIEKLEKERINNKHILEILTIAFEELNFSDSAKKLNDYVFYKCDETTLNFIEEKLEKIKLINLKIEEIRSLTHIIKKFDNKILFDKLKKRINNAVNACFAKGELKQTLQLLELIPTDNYIENYKTKVKDQLYAKAEKLIKNSEYNKALDNLLMLKDYKNANELIKLYERKAEETNKKENYELGLNLYKKGNYKLAFEKFSISKDYKDSKKLLEECLERINEKLFLEKMKYLLNVNEIVYKVLDTLTIVALQNQNNHKNVFCIFFFSEEIKSNEIYNALAKSRLENIKKNHTHLLIDSEVYIIFCDSNWIIEQGYYIFEYTENNFIQLTKNEFQKINSELVVFNDIDNLIKTNIKKMADVIECVKAYTGELELYKSTKEKLQSLYSLIDKSIHDDKELKVMIQGSARSGKTIIALALLRNYKKAKFLLMNYYFYISLKSAFLAKNLDFPYDKIFHHDTNRDHSEGCGINLNYHYDSYEASFKFSTDFVIVDEAQRLCNLLPKGNYSGFDELYILTLKSKIGIFLGDDQQRINPKYDEGFDKIIQTLKKANRTFYSYEFDGSVGIPSNLVNAYKYILYDDETYFDHIENNKILLSSNIYDFIDDFNRNTDDSKHYSTVTGYSLSGKVKNAGLRELPWEMRTKDCCFLNKAYQNYVFTTFDVISRDLHYMYLIIPKEISYSTQQGIYHKNGPRNNYTKYLLNHLYVNMTRATEKLIIYCEDNMLFNYLREKLSKVCVGDIFLENRKNKIIEQKLNFVRSNSDISRKSTFIGRLKKHNFNGFIHATEYDNVLKILKDNKLKSRIDNTGLFQDIADSNVIVKTSDFVKNKVRFYYAKDTPTLFHFDKKANNLVILVFDEKIIGNYPVYYTDGNAASQYTSITGVMDEAINFDWDSIFSRGPIIRDKQEIVRKRNAELLVIGPVDVKTFLKKIIVKDFFTADNIKKQFPIYSNIITVEQEN